MEETRGRHLGIRTPSYLSTYKSNVCRLFKFDSRLPSPVSTELLKASEVLEGNSSAGSTDGLLFLEVALLVAGQAQPLNNTFLLNCCQADNFGRGDSSEKMLLPCQEDQNSEAARDAAQSNRAIFRTRCPRVSPSRNHRNSGCNLARVTRNEFGTHRPWPVCVCVCVCLCPRISRVRLKGEQTYRRLFRLCQTYSDLFHLPYRWQRSG